MSKLSVFSGSSPPSVHIRICTVKKVIHNVYNSVATSISYFHLFQEPSITINLCLRCTILSSNTCNIHHIWQLTVRYQLQKETVCPFASYVVDRRTKQICVFTVNSSYKEVCCLYVCFHVCHTREICMHCILNTFTHRLNGCI